MASQHSKIELRDSRRTSRGFSLIELLVVVAIILILMAIAIPSFLRARIAANEATAAENCRTISSANVIYWTTYGVGFAPAMANFSTPASGNVSATTAGLLDDILVAGTKTGYVFTYVALSPDANGYYNDYTLNADPVSAGITGQRHFFTNEPAVIRVNLTVPASGSDPPL
jgi:prepilin-type N-terminal cleavage/methylation domain-containing protein